MRIHKTPAIFFFLLIACVLSGRAAPVTAADTSRAIMIQLRASESPDAPLADTVKLYDASFALVIGIDDYTNGWPRLSNAVSDADSVAAELRRKGFEVTFLKNLNSRELKDAFEKFFVFKGQDPNARLFAWFAGHGHTMDNEGYIVPADAPRPKNKGAFKYRALSLRRFGELARLAESKHALAVFDSCFSGTVFSTGRAMPPPAVTRATTYPVREFISSGDANQQVSDDGRFRKLFIRAMEGEEPADLNNDGYLTGSELGMFLADRVSNLTKNAQTPRYGKLRDENYDRGDFIFQVASSGTQKESLSEKSSQTILSVASNVSGASVFLDDQLIGTSPIKKRVVASGDHAVRVEKNGYEAYQTRIFIRSGRHLALNAYLDKKVLSTGNLYVDTRPSGTKIRILNIVPVYFRGMALSPGDYHVEASKAGYETDDQWVTVTAGEDKYVTLALTPVNVPAHVAKGFSLPSSGTGGDKPRPYTDSTTSMAFVWVPGGCYQMGCGVWASDCEDDEKPFHKVCLNGFFMGKTEVTQGQWKAIMGNNPSKFLYCGDDCPVEWVSWNEVQAFIRNLNKLSGKSYRLPTEAEWEYAARSMGKPERYAGGDDINTVAWYKLNSRDWFTASTHKVGTLAPNGLGIYDMSGNVWEWCSDWYGRYLPSSMTNPTGQSSGSGRVVRGGSWNDTPEDCQSANRDWYDPDRRFNYLGFRLALSPVR